MGLGDILKKAELKFCSDASSGYLSFLILEINDQLPQGINVSEIISGGVIKTFNFRDPDGNLLNVCYETEISPYYQD